MRSWIRAGFFAAAFLIAVEGEARLTTYDVGYGVKSKGMGGIAVAYAQDSLVGATNPAGLVWVGNSFDAELSLLYYPRGYSYEGATGVVPAFGFPTSDHYRGKPVIRPIPALGFSRCIGNGAAIGIALYGAGGDTSYDRTNPIAAGLNNPGFGGFAGATQQKNSLTLRQIMLALSYSQWIAPCHSIGIALIGGMQGLKVRGVQLLRAPSLGIGPLSVSPEHVTDNGTNYVFGGGLRIGYYGKIGGILTIGASYTTKQWYARMRAYRGIVPQEGRLDIPPIIAAGITWHVTPCMNLGFEYQFINYQSERVWSNRVQQLTVASQLAGSRDGPGFGWRDANIFKVGVDYRHDCNVTVRGGWAYTPVPFNNEQIDLNILTQDLVEHHITLGGTYRWDCCSQFDVALWYGVRKKKRGQSQILGGDLGTLEQFMYQYNLTFGYHRSF